LIGVFLNAQYRAQFTPNGSSRLEGIATERIKGDGIDGYRRALELLAKRRDA
jgi:hypothetical protein